MLDIRSNVILAPYTTFRIGGPAKFFTEADSADEIKEALTYARENGLKFFFLGGGSNILISDGGFDGLVIKTKDADDLTIQSEKGLARCGAGTALPKLVNWSVKNGLAGLEWAAGIPGTVGGAIRGNVGAFGGEIKDVIVQVFALEIGVDGRFLEKNFSGEECAFEYRGSVFKNNPKLVIIGAELRLSSGKKDLLAEETRKIIAKRAKKQPKGGGNIGSFFKNPTVTKKETLQEFEEESGAKVADGKIPAGWLIERADMKGKTVGGAMVSPVHANFIVNTGTATAENVIMLASIIKQKVRIEFDIQLCEEVQLVGF